MMGGLRPALGQLCRNTLWHCPKDADRVVVSLVELGALSPVEDMGPNSIQYMLDYYISRLKTSRSVQLVMTMRFHIPAPFQRLSRL